MFFSNKKKYILSMNVSNEKKIEINLFWRRTETISDQSAVYCSPQYNEAYELSYTLQIKNTFHISC